jgi:enoyl-CoA hydratase
MDEAFNMAVTLAGKAPRAIALAKMAVNEGVNLSLEEGLQLEAELFGQAIATEDHREGAAAFLEKRQPKWSGT